MKFLTIVSTASTAEVIESFTTVPYDYNKTDLSDLFDILKRGYALHLQDSDKVFKSMTWHVTLKYLTTDDGEVIVAINIPSFQYNY